jgi:ribosome-binding protein aMBF1 (putative translation factor)
MIKNERQYAITKVQSEKFERALAELRQRPAGNVHPVLHKAETEALRSQLADLRSELEQYDRLRSRRRRVLRVKSFDELPRLLIQARIAAGLSQKQLAGRLGLKEQQIQRYEATEYASAKLERIEQVVRALGLAVRMESVVSGGSRGAL